MQVVDGYGQPLRLVLGKAALTAKGRKQIKEGNFALPGGRYPIHDISHARNALSRVAQHGTAAEEKNVKAAVHRKYPSLKPETDEGEGNPGNNSDVAPAQSEVNRHKLEKADKGGPYIGPRGGKWADPDHKIPWKKGAKKTAKKEPVSDVVKRHPATATWKQTKHEHITTHDAGHGRYTSMQNRGRAGGHNLLYLPKGQKRAKIVMPDGTEKTEQPSGEHPHDDFNSVRRVAAKHHEKIEPYKSQMTKGGRLVLRKTQPMEKAVASEWIAIEADPGEGWRRLYQGQWFYWWATKAAAKESLAHWEAQVTKFGVMSEDRAVGPAFPRGWEAEQVAQGARAFLGGYGDPPKKNNKGGSLGWNPIANDPAGGMQRFVGGFRHYITAIFYWWPSAKATRQALQHYREKRAQAELDYEKAKAAGKKIDYGENRAWHYAELINAAEQRLKVWKGFPRGDQQQKSEGPQPTSPDNHYKMVMRTSRTMNKAEVGATMDLFTAKPQADSSFSVGDYLFEFRKSDDGVGVLTVDGPDFPLPYHMVCGSLAKARTLAPGVVKDFEEGRCPGIGMYRAISLAPEKYPGRHEGAH